MFVISCFIPWCLGKTKPLVFQESIGIYLHGQKRRERFPRRDYLCVVLLELKRIDRRRISVFCNLAVFILLNDIHYLLKQLFLNLTALYIYSTYIHAREGSESEQHWAPIPLPLSRCVCGGVKIFWHEI